MASLLVFKNQKKLTRRPILKVRYFGPFSKVHEGTHYTIQRDSKIWDENVLEFELERCIGDQKRISSRDPGTAGFHKATGIE